MNIKNYYLKVKAKSLAAEAVIIRQEERKVKRIPWDRRRQEYKYYGKTYFTDPVNNLWNHRIWNVRNEARATHLARAFLKGQPYKKVEPKCKNPHMREYYIIPRVVKMVAKYGPDSKVTKDVIKTWVDGYENT